MRIERRTFNKLALAGAATGFAGSARAQAKPLTIGFGMALTGGLAPNGKAALLAMQIAEEDINARGGMLGRPVKLVYYDDQSNPSTRSRPLYQAPGCRQGRHRGERLRHQHDRAGDADRNAEGPHLLRPARAGGEFRVQLPALFLDHRRRADRSPRKPSPRASSKSPWRRTPSRRRWPWSAPMRNFPATPWRACATSPRRTGSRSSTTRPTRRPRPTIRRSCARWPATNPDVFFAASYPPDSVGIIRASSEIGFKPKIYGGGMVGLQATAIKTQLGPLLNGIVVYDFWLPWASFASDEGREFLKKYQAKSAAAGVDLLGYYLPPFGYALMQIVEQAVKGAGGTDDAKLADFMRKAHLQDHCRRHQVQRGRRVGDRAGDGGAVPGGQGQRCRPVQGSQDRSDPVAGPSTRPATSSIRTIRRSDEPKARHRGGVTRPGAQRRISCRGNAAVEILRLRLRMTAAVTFARRATQPPSGMTALRRPCRP